MPKLDELRREIDAIDSALLDLLIRRIEIGRDVARAKAKGTTAHLRPGREATIIRRLVSRSKEPLAPQSIGRIWREILSANLNQQNPIEAALYAPELAIQLLAHDYCGSTTTQTLHASAWQVLDAVSSGQAQIGILPGIIDGQAWRWWPLLLTTPHDRKPRIIARLPFVAGGSARGEALIVATQDPELTGDDRTIYAGPLGADIEGGQTIDVWRSTKTWQLVETRGGGSVPGKLDKSVWQCLGAYADPVIN